MAELISIVENGQTWLFSDECGCGSWDCIPTQYAMVRAKEVRTSEWD